MNFNENHNPNRRRFVIHEHHASRLHFDFRLEINDVLKSWAVPKGLSLDPKVKRLAVAVPDHSLSYISFEGQISEGNYGAGEVRVWDAGFFETKSDAAQQLEKGRMSLTLFGKKLRGGFVLFKMQDEEKNWLIVKTPDEFADPHWEMETVLPRA